jgi:hypothetical protein
MVQADRATQPKKWRTEKLASFIAARKSLCIQKLSWTMNGG